jgi:hypothetical protein
MEQDKNPMVEHALRELEIMGIEDNGDDAVVETVLHRQIVETVTAFSNTNIAGFTANVATKLLFQLLRSLPLTPLTGEVDEWIDHTETNKGLPLFQNKRYKQVWKNSTEAWDLEAYIQWEWYTDDVGNQQKKFYVTPESKKIITFPYMPNPQLVEKLPEGAPSEAVIH